MEGLRDVAECRQHLRGVVDEIAQLALVHRVAARAEPEVIELHIATGPREFAGRELRAEGLVEIDRHQFFPAMCSAARYPNAMAGPIVPPGPGIGVAHHRGADIARGIKPVDHRTVVTQRAACTSVRMPPLVPRSPGTILAA